MDMGLDKTAADEAPASVMLRPIRRQRGFDRHNAPAGDANIHRRGIRRMRQPGIADDQVHDDPLPCRAMLARR